MYQVGSCEIKSSNGCHVQTICFLDPGTSRSKCYWSLLSQVPKHAPWRCCTWYSFLVSGLYLIECIVACQQGGAPFLHHPGDLWCTVVLCDSLIVTMLSQVHQKLLFSAALSRRGGQSPQLNTGTPHSNNIICLGLKFVIKTDRRSGIGWLGLWNWGQMCQINGHTCSLKCATQKCVLKSLSIVNSDMTCTLIMKYRLCM